MKREKPSIWSTFNDLMMVVYAGFFGIQFFKSRKHFMLENDASSK